MAAGCSFEPRADPCGGTRSRRWINRLASIEHPHLKHRPVRVEPRHQGGADRLEHEMDVAWPALRVGPEANIDLVGRFADLGLGRAHRLGDVRQEWTELGAFHRIEICQVHDMPDWLDHDCPHPQRTHAVLNDPVADGRDAPSRHILRVLDQVAGKALHYRDARGSTSSGPP